MTNERFLERVADRAGGSSLADAEWVTRVVFGVLGERLSRLEAEALSRELPERLGGYLRVEGHGQVFDLPEFYARIAIELGVRTGIAVEQANIVCQTLAELVRGEVIQRLHRELPHAFGALLTAREALPPPPVVHLHPERRTLAEGRPGGTRPLYAAQPDRAHSQSVARSDDPHADVKLSSARGLTQEREEETLASYHPGESGS